MRTTVKGKKLTVYITGGDVHSWPDLLTFNSFVVTRSELSKL